MYKSVENAPAVVQVHKDFLLLRDYTGLAILFLVVFGGIAVYEIQSKEVGLIYISILVAQYVVVRQAASNYGTRMVTTVLAEKCAEAETASGTRRSRGKT